MYEKVLLFAGTTEGRQLYGFLRQQGIRAVVCVTTEYGKTLLEEAAQADKEQEGAAPVRICVERMDCNRMKKEIESFCPQLVVDATHPYATEATKNIIKACELTQTDLIRICRNKIERIKDPHIIYVKSMRAAVEFLSETAGTVFVTTGSKELPALTQLHDYRERIYARILPDVKMLEKTLRLGIPAERILCVRGPVSQEMNEAAMRFCGASWMLTKESGK
ncbi:MAG TPA: precorrin-6A reductase, partial [Lachnospiraceae bacterium]|nr:precorrin-6A reductase [Lachnospiraceae bacterium]